MKYGYIYKITIGPKYYYGQTTNRIKRKSQHKRELERGVHGNIYMQNAYNKYRKFRFEVLHRVPINKLSPIEFDYVSAHITDKDCMNLVIPLPDGTHSITEETRRRLSESHKGQTPSREARKKISEFHKGRKKSPEHVKKVVESRMSKGYTHSAETKEKLRKANLGRKLGRKTIEKIARASRKPCVLVSPDGKKYRFRGVREAGDYFGVHYTSLARFLKGSRAWPTKDTKGPTSIFSGWTGYYE